MIGDTLKQRREAMGLDLREISNSLKIRYDYLKALEDNVTGKLPEDVYTRGYIRGYARFLDIDPESLVEAYAAQRAAQDAAPEPQTNQPAAGFRVSKPMVIIPAAAVLGVVLFITLPMLTGGRDQRNTALSIAPQARHYESVAPEASAPSSAISGGGAMGPQESGQHYSLLVKADEAVWLRVGMDDGKSDEALLKPGESKEWTSQHGFDLKVGNAGGVRVVLNGKDVGALGNQGQVVRIRLPKEESVAAALSR